MRISARTWGRERKHYIQSIIKFLSLNTRYLPSLSDAATGDANSAGLICMLIARIEDIAGHVFAFDYTWAQA